MTEKIGLKLGTLTNISGSRGKQIGERIYVDSKCPHCDHYNETTLTTLEGPYVIVCQKCDEEYALE